MITKPPSTSPLPADPRLRAGAEAERQMAHYLNRELAASPDVHVLFDLRIVDPNQPEQDGSDGVAQIDALVIHRWGMFIVESKSVSEAVSVRSDGSGGDEWSRFVNGKSQGMPSPIQQARRQAEFLRRFLQDRREQLLGKVKGLMGVFVRTVAGTDQRSFRNLPIQIIVAISDRGEIRRASGWEPPTEPFRCFLCKADLVPTKIKDEIANHRAGDRPLKDDIKNPYGSWSMAAEEPARVAQFLADHHQARSPTAQPAPAPSALQAATAPAPAVPAAPTTTSTPATPVCRHCASAALTARWGKYGYYWSCGDCQKNTPMPTTCSICGATGDHGKTVRIRKDGPQYFRKCEPCGVEEVIWREADA